MAVFQPDPEVSAPNAGQKMELVQSQPKISLTALPKSLLIVGPTSIEIQ